MLVSHGANPSYRNLQSADAWSYARLSEDVGEFVIQAMKDAQTNAVQVSVCVRVCVCA